MAVFVELTTDPFEETRRMSAAWQRSRLSSHSARNVRRPTQGLELKGETPAILKVIDSGGRPVSLVDSGRFAGEEGQGYGNFLLQSVKEARAEKAQIVETFGESFVYFYGDAPRFIDAQAILVNSKDFPWPAEWWENYERYFRGTRLAERGARSYLFYDDNIVEGFMMSCSDSMQADQRHIVQLTFRMFVTNHQSIRVAEQSTARATVIDLPPAGAPVAGGMLVPRSGVPGALGAPGAFGAPRQRIDEYMAPPNPEALGARPGPSAAQPAGATRPSKTELVRTSIAELSHYGADINDPGALEALGLGGAASAQPAATDSGTAGFHEAAASAQALSAPSEPDPLVRVFGAAHVGASQVVAGTHAVAAEGGSGSVDAPAVAQPRPLPEPMPSTQADRADDVLPEPFALVVLPGELHIDADAASRGELSIGGLSGAQATLGLTAGARRARAPEASAQSHAYQRRAYSS